MGFLPVEKRAQVFVSSTYLDLIEERQAVNKTLLELGCFPAGMELFPAGEDDKWDLIQGVIDDSDYYALILSGKYGSIDEKTDISYTEMEFDYAVSTSKPVMAFIRKDLTKLQIAEAEIDEGRRNKLEAFHEKVKSKRNVKFFETKDELAAALATSLVPMTRRYPPVGWVRGNYAMTPEVQTELAELRLQAATAATSHEEPVFDDLEEGADLYQFDAYVDVKLTPAEEKDRGKNIERLDGWVHPSLSWDEIFTAVSPSLLQEISDNDLSSILERFFMDYVLQNNPDFEDYEGSVSYYKREIRNIDSHRDDLIVQFLALRLIERGVKKRTISDNARYWKLTQKGEDRMMQLRARRKGSRVSIDA